VLYKKIDSTLRGNFAVEIAAARRAVIGLLAGSDPGVASLAIVAPAFPVTGRTTHGGWMFLNDIPLEASELTPGLGGLLCTGGETARAVLDAAGAAGLRLLGEAEPGVPLGTAVGWRDRPVVTKAGAFGTERTLVRCRAALRHLLRGDIPLSLLIVFMVA